jgi:hypothetical protein
LKEARISGLVLAVLESRRVESDDVVSTSCPSGLNTAELTAVCYEKATKSCAAITVRMAAAAVFSATRTKTGLPDLIVVVRKYHWPEFRRSDALDWLELILGFAQDAHATEAGFESISRGQAPREAEAQPAIQLVASYLGNVADPLADDNDGEFWSMARYSPAWSQFAQWLDAGPRVKLSCRVIPDLRNPNQTARCHGRRLAQTLCKVGRSGIVAA